MDGWMWWNRKNMDPMLMTWMKLWWHWWNPWMKVFDATHRWKCLIKPMDESIWWNPWMKVFDETHGWNYLMKSKDEINHIFHDQYIHPHGIFCGNLHNLEIASATFMEDFVGRKWPEVKIFRGKEVFLLSQDFFFWKNKMGLFNPRTLC
jgi:hypothetical protein